MPDVGNYYLIYGKEFWHGRYGYGGGCDGIEINEGDTVYWTSSYIRFSEEPLFKNEVTAFDYIFGTGATSDDYWGAFSDELIDGRTYTMHLPLGSYGHTLYLNKEDLSILYPFTGDLASSGFAEPIRLPSNVEGGAGVLGSATECIYEWDEREIIGSFP